MTDKKSKPDRPVADQDGQSPDNVSPYLKRPIRSIAEIERAREDSETSVKTPKPRR